MGNLKVRIYADCLHATGTKEMFYVVEFTGGTVEVVPDTWLCDKGQWCYWPPFRGKQIVDAIRNKRDCDYSWKKTSVQKIMSKCGKLLS